MKIFSQQKRFQIEFISVDTEITLYHSDFKEEENDLDITLEFLNSIEIGKKINNKFETETYKVLDFGLNIDNQANRIQVYIKKI